ncbi:MAG: CcmD family protein [Actinomycetota bacterium]
MPDAGLGWLAAAFIVTWVIIGAYLVRLARAQRAIDRKLNEIAKDRGPSPD